MGDAGESYDDDRARWFRPTNQAPNKDLSYLTELVEGDLLRPVIDSCYRLSDAAAAMEHVGEGKHKGKIVITMD